MTSILLFEIGVENFNGKARIFYKNHKKLLEIFSLIKLIYQGTNYFIKTNFLNFGLSDWRVSRWGY